jgi:excinuclease ABC subunit A
VWDHVRKLFAETTEAKVRGYLPGRFSFNVKGVAARAARADVHDQDRDELPPDVYVPCECAPEPGTTARRSRCTSRARRVDILAMPIEEAAEFFRAVPAISRT